MVAIVEEIERLVAGGDDSGVRVMLEVVIENRESSILNSVIRRCDNRMHFARQGSSSQACFMRQASTSTEQVSSAQSCVYLNKSCGSANEGSSNAFEAPLFSRPIARMQQNYPNLWWKSANQPHLSLRSFPDETEKLMNNCIPAPGTEYTLFNLRCWRVASSNDTYHKREISQGPYKVVWTLPSNLNQMVSLLSLWTDFYELPFLNIKNVVADACIYIWM
ncbi:hypothetical protein LOK49_LG04G00305 [Camellia lanceoleosa]|uniref:Uncharacterized protein n=1 Tax=Camellia lanceoleosa TaxID=1840588 RepID=A0ACC0HYG0_9ERIC|nr:hypothetical protein LOK49_LG04G00305 [Camellia lanceoleosa]